MGDVIDRVPAWVIVLFCLCVAASWLPAVRFARTGLREGIHLAAFFLVVGSMSTNSPSLVAAAVVTMAVVTVWLVATGNKPRARPRAVGDPARRGRHRATDERGAE